MIVMLVRIDKIQSKKYEQSKNLICLQYNSRRQMQKVDDLFQGSLLLQVFETGVDQSDV